MSHHILVSIRWEPVRRVEVPSHFPNIREGAVSYAQAVFRFRGTTYLAVADENVTTDVIIDQSHLKRTAEANQNDQNEPTGVDCDARRVRHV